MRDINKTNESIRRLLREQRAELVAFTQYLKERIPVLQALRVDEDVVSEFEQIIPAVKDELALLQRYFPAVWGNVGSFLAWSNRNHVIGWAKTGVVIGKDGRKWICHSFHGSLAYGKEEPESYFREVTDLLMQELLVKGWREYLDLALHITPIEHWLARCSRVAGGPRLALYPEWNLGFALLLDLIFRIWWKSDAGKETFE